MMKCEAVPDKPKHGTVEQSRFFLRRLPSLFCNYEIYRQKFAKNLPKSEVLD
jgi:hypothetical protein